MFVLKPLRSRPLALLWSGQVLSAIGDEIYKVALIWLAVEMVGKDAGFLAALQAGSVLVFGLCGGLFADHADRKRVLVGADVLRGLIVLVPPLLVRWHPLGLASLVLIAVGVSSLGAFFDPALQEALPDLAESEDELHTTNALIDATRRLARVIGPGIVGILTGLVPTVHFFTLDAASFFLSALSVLGLGKRLPPQTLPTREGPTVRRVVDGLSAGARIVWDYPLLRFSILRNGIDWAAWSLAFTLALPLELRSTPGAGMRSYGLILSAYGIGNLLSNLWVGSHHIHRPGTTMFLGLGIMGCAVAALAYAPSLPWKMCAAAVAAVGGPMDDLALMKVIQVRYRGKDIARIFRLQLAVSHLGLLVAFLASPLLFRLVSPREVIFFCGLTLLSVAAVGLVRFGGVFVPFGFGGSRQ